MPVLTVIAKVVIGAAIGSALARVALKLWPIDNYWGSLDEAPKKSK